MFPKLRLLKLYGKEKLFLKEIWKGILYSFFGRNRNIVAKPSCVEALLKGRVSIEGNLEGSPILVFRSLIGKLLKPYWKEKTA